MSRYNSTAELGSAARDFLRDHPKYFEETYTPLQAATIKLSVPLVASLEIRAVDDNTEVTDFSIDNRNGVVKIPDVSTLKNGVHMYGYHYEWFLEEDLEFYADVILQELTFDSDMSTLNDFTDYETKLAAVGTVMYALFSLMTEFATDIDVSTPEGIMIPAHMRFQQVMQMFQYWKQKFDELASSANLGPNKISQYNLRRISRMTGRYVPVFRGREIDDPRWPVRVFPEIPELVADDAPDSNGTYINDYGVSFDGWESIGGSGG